MSKCFFVLASCIMLSIPITAQSIQSGEGKGISVRVGASFSTFNPDYGCSNNSPWACWDGQLMGISPSVSTNAFLFERIGAEAQARFLQWHGPGDLTEASYMAGPRVKILRHERVTFSGKFLIGVGHFNISRGTGSGTYLAYAPGGLVDYAVTRRLFARFDYEYQFWPTFEGSSTGSGHGGLTPNGLSLGIVYALTR